MAEGGSDEVSPLVTGGTVCRENAAGTSRPKQEESHSGLEQGRHQIEPERGNRRRGEKWRRKRDFERRDDRRERDQERRDDRRERDPERRDDRRERDPERRDDRRERDPERRDDRRERDPERRDDEMKRDDRGGASDRRRGGYYAPRWGRNWGNGRRGRREPQAEHSRHPHRDPGHKGGQEKLEVEDLEGEEIQSDTGNSERKPRHKPQRPNQTRPAKTTTRAGPNDPSPAEQQDGNKHEAATSGHPQGEVKENTEMKDCITKTVTDESDTALAQKGSVVLEMSKENKYRLSGGQRGETRSRERPEKREAGRVRDSGHTSYQFDRRPRGRDYHRQHEAQSARGHKRETTRVEERGKNLSDVAGTGREVSNYAELRSGSRASEKSDERSKKSELGAEESERKTRSKKSKPRESELDSEEKQTHSKKLEPNTDLGTRPEVGDQPSKMHSKRERPTTTEKQSAHSTDQRWRHNRPQYPRPRGKRAVPTVQSDQLAQELTSGTYDCMVCYERVRVRDQVWSCGSCYHVFHLHCIKKWATSPAAAMDNDSPSEGWRCPGCQNPSKVIPTIYKCYCGKVTNPRPRSRGELTIPHSCAELCLKKLAQMPESTCKHRCQLLCHPGPCPPCPVMVNRSCPCGRKSYHVRCSRSTSLPSCGAQCERALVCGRHQCEEKCHSGPCPQCTVLLFQRCHCGRTEKRVCCGEVTGETFACGEICNRKLDCGNHLCELPCHEGACPSCLLLPDHVTTCPCGATPLSSLLPEGESRTSCLDPIPTCNHTCGQRLPCSTREEPHYCDAECHEGECPPCGKTRSLSCHCGRSVMTVPCDEIGVLGEFRCQHVCNQKKNCGRHRCNIRCCTDSEHVCDLVCGRKLRCGNHTCQEMCHSKSCNQCWQYSYEELACHCGAEVILPPIPCGTPPPPCTHPCARIHPCQHPVNHTCHSEEECPPCTFLTEKMCMGEHELRRNIPCHIADISCGKPCGKPLPCNMHNCRRTCHKGTCLQRVEDCGQPCTKKRKFCDHECRKPCHVGQPCPDTPCKAEVVVKCKCGRKWEKMYCMASESGAMHQAFQKLLSKDLGAKIRDLQSGQSVSIASVTVSSLSKERALECDEVCAQEERNRRLAAALDIENPLINPLASYEPQYSQFLLEQARTDLQFVSSVEEILRSLVEAVHRSSSVQMRTHSFRPMKNSQRRVIHELSAHYGCDTISYDPEPQRNVIATAKKTRVCLPAVSLTKLVERERFRPAPPPVNVMAVSGRTEKMDGGGGGGGLPDYFADDLKL